MAQLNPEDRAQELATNEEKAEREAKRVKKAEREVQEFREAEERRNRASQEHQEGRRTLQAVCREVGITKMEYKRLIRAADDVDASKAKEMLQALEANLQHYNGQSPDVTAHLTVMQAKKRIRALGSSAEGVRLLALIFPA